MRKDLVSQELCESLEPTPLVGLDHIAVAVEDLAAAERWYSQVLGFRCVDRKVVTGKASGMISSVMQAGPIVFVLLQGTDPRSQVARFVNHFGQGVQHIAMRVNDIHGAVDYFKRRQLAFSTNIVKGDGLLQSFTKRSRETGLMFELVERGEFPGFDDQNVHGLFRQLEDNDEF